jgi:uncharacterized protein YebE (UPF0316 family)
MFKKIIILFIIGLLEQLLYTLYIIAIGKYLIFISSILMFSYMVLYLLIISKVVKEKEGLILLLDYALACGVGNYMAMSMHLIK